MQADETITPGHHPEMTNEQYHASGGVSKSHLDDIAPPNSPYQYWNKHLNPEREPRAMTPALLLGQAIHGAVLEPDLMTENFITVPDDMPNRPTERQRKAQKPSPETLRAIELWDEFNRESLGKTVLTPKELQTVTRCRDAVHRHPVAGPLFDGGLKEQTYFAIDPDTGELIKCRIDQHFPERQMMVDLKTTEDANPEDFGKSAANYRYDVQSVFYPHVYQNAGGDKTKHFIFVGVQKEWPNEVGIFFFEEETIYDDGRIYRHLDEARAMARRDLRAIAALRAANKWPDHGITPTALRMPAWARHRRI